MFGQQEIPILGLLQLTQNREDDGNEKRRTTKDARNRRAGNEQLKESILETDEEEPEITEEKTIL